MKSFEKLVTEVQNSKSDIPCQYVNTNAYNFLESTVTAYDQTDLIAWLCQCAIDTGADINHIHLNQTQLNELIDVLGALSIALGLASGAPLLVVAEGAVEQYAVERLIMDAGKMYDERRPNLIDQLLHNKKEYR